MRVETLQLSDAGTKTYFDKLNKLCTICCECRIMSKVFALLSTDFDCQKLSVRANLYLRKTNDVMFLQMRAVGHCLTKSERRLQT